ncbi:MAG: glycoside hydrolase [Acidobacteriota bacterium]|nr:glycoside hydrolase [Acidobacteriota bacterium]MDW3228711.1 glycoside hydrolase [Acidobacteriota bacterium]
MKHSKCIIFLVGIMVFFTATIQLAQESRNQKETALIKMINEELISKPPAKLMLDPFYEKYVDAMGIPIIASAAVSDTALLIAREIIIQMLSERPDIRRTLVRTGQKVGIIGQTQQMSDIPEYKNLKKPEFGDRRLTAKEIAEYDKIKKMSDQEYWNRRARGLGGVYTTCGEENLLGIPETRYFGEHILVHEFAHAIHRGIRACDPELAEAIDQAYADAMAIGLWKGQYASTNSGEYFAEGTQFWFWSNYEYQDGDKVVYSPLDLRTYDPKLYDLLARIFPLNHRISLDVYYNFKENYPELAKKN